MVQSTRELWYAFFAILMITLLYLFVVIVLGDIPAASDFFGHSIGIVGFVLMLMTETLYSLRKRSKHARWGRMSTWLQFHIFTGLVGPYLVLLHSSWKFNGLAGVVLLMTAVVVVSGFIGRYIYTAIPRTADGIELEAEELERRIRSLEAELNNWLVERPGAFRQVYPASLTPGSGVSSQGHLEGLSFDWGSRAQCWFAKLQMDSTTRAQVNQLENLFKRRRTFRRQAASLTRARKLMAVWHAVHIPLGMALFTAAIVHIVAAIYYATLLR